MSVETTTIALCVATLVVLILLMSCAGSPKRKSGSSYHSQNQCGRDGMQDRESISDDQLSNYGRGKENRDAAQRESDLQDLDEYDDYNSVAQYQSLEPEVFESHDEYSSNISVASHGASALSTTSHDNYPVSFVGLRRPDMHSIYADSSARQQHSEYADQMPSHSSYML